MTEYDLTFQSAGTRVVLECEERNFVLDWAKPFPAVWGREPRA